MRIGSLFLACVASLMGAPAPAQNAAVKTLRVPDGGIQPQVVLDETGAAHLLYYKGDPGHGDLYYAVSPDGSGDFKPAMSVNSTPGSAIAAGNIRGAHLAIGARGAAGGDGNAAGTGAANGSGAADGTGVADGTGAAGGKRWRAHVAWNGSGKAEPKAEGGETPMLYARLAGDGRSFEPERNLIRKRPGLDGGGSVAADRSGRVYVFWHAPDAGARDEANRRVWMARSSDEGKTFSEEEAIFEKPTGACGCCGLKAFAAADGGLFVLYRAASNRVDRDMVLLRSPDGGKTFQGAGIDPWSVGQCVMSSASFADGPRGVLAAWETRDRVFFAGIRPAGAAIAKIVAAAGPTPADAGKSGPRQKYPALAVNRRGEMLVAWTEGMGWQRGGAVRWQLFDPEGKPVPGAAGRAEGVPVWSLVAVFAAPDGSFRVMY